MSFISKLFGFNFGGNRMLSRYYLNAFLGQKTEQLLDVSGCEIDRYNEIPELKLVIDRKASMMANAKFKHYGRDGKLIENSSIINFLEKPNPLQSRNEFLKQMEIQVCIFGNAFTYKLQGSRVSETPSALWNLPPSLLKIERSGKIYKQYKLEDIINKYSLSVSGSDDMIFEVNEVMHSNIPDPQDPLMGLSPIHSLRLPLSNIRGAYQTRNVLIYNKGAIGILSNEGNKDASGGALPLKKTERERIEKEYKKNYGIGKDQMQILISESNLKWQSIAPETKKMMLFEEIEENFMRIIDMYGLNSNIFSFSKGATYENLYNGIKLAYQDTIIPESKDRGKSLSNFLGLTEKGEWIEPCFDHIPILAEDGTKQAETMKKKAETYQILVNNGVPANDALERVGLDELQNSL